MFDIVKIIRTICWADGSTPIRVQTIGLLTNNGLVTEIGSLDEWGG